MLPDRRRLVLKALVEEYITTGQPVGSKNLVDRYGITCSPATVRNELAALEENGYVFQPHISAGRIPTDAGYREFVDDLLVGPEVSDSIHSEELRRRQMALATEVDDLMLRTSTVLSHVTHYVAVVLAPTISLVRIRRIDLLSMSPHRALIVLITESGQVVNRHIELAESIAVDRLAEVERALNASLDGKRAAEVRPLREALDPEVPGDGLVAGVLDGIIECLEEADRDRVHHVGVPELAALPEFAQTSRLRPLLGLLEDGLAMLDTLSEVISSGGLTVRIGSENTRSELGDMSLVVTGYGTSQADGIVGVIGPTRMDYQRTISAVRSVAEDLSDALG
ncbi:MAG: heat-inducible transcriptional repressor HrcA [Actinomycetota bacterium]|nr:heat-inducible transcriptional repressor HrcA [Actinomycetota bacterium]